MYKFWFYSRLITIFDSVEDTLARKSSSELALFSRLIRIFALKFHNNKKYERASH